MKAPTHAERVLLELGIDRPQDIDLEAIAWHLGAVVNYRPMDGAEATIVGGKTKAVIAVNSLSMPERRRFSLGHELGHWRYHRGRCLVCASSDIGRFEASNPLERQADGFASDLLLPGYLVRSYFNKIKSLSLRAVRDIATEFKASLTATLIRLVDEDQFPIAIVCHGQGGRRWGKRSPSVEGGGSSGMISIPRVLHSSFSTRVAMISLILDSLEQTHGSISEAPIGMKFASRATVCPTTRSSHC